MRPQVRLGAELPWVHWPHSHSAFTFEVCPSVLLLRLGTLVFRLLRTQTVSLTIVLGIYSWVLWAVLPCVVHKKLPDRFPKRFASLWPMSHESVRVSVALCACQHWVCRVFILFFRFALLTGMSYISLWFYLRRLMTNDVEHFFHGLLCHPCSFFVAVSDQILCPFKKIICFLILLINLTINFKYREPPPNSWPYFQGRLLLMIMCLWDENSGKK